MASKNLYHRRMVAEASAKACWICYKPSSTVLITPDQDDWFHVCPGHLKDPKFAIAKDAEDLAEKKRKEELDREIEAVKKEFEEKMRKKMERRKQKEFEKDGKKAEVKKEETKDDADEEKAKDEKLKELESKKDPAKPTLDGPRVFELTKQFWSMRLQKKRDMEQAKRQRERMKELAKTGFPSVPSGELK